MLCVWLESLSDLIAEIANVVRGNDRLDVGRKSAASRLKIDLSRAVHLFSGVAHCACGQKMYFTTSSPNRYVCQKCRNKVPIVDLEGVFHEQLKHFFFSPEEIGNQLKKADEALAEKERLIGSWKWNAKNSRPQWTEPTASISRTN